MDWILYEPPLRPCVVFKNKTAFDPHYVWRHIDPTDSNSMSSRVQQVRR